MCEIMEKIAREERAEGRREGMREGRREVLFGLVKDGILTVADAAKRAGMPEDVFKENMKQFKVEHMRN